MPQEILADECESRIRIDSLASYHILDTPPEPEFDEVTRLLAHVCEVPIAVVNLIDQDRQWFKSHFGTEIAETSLDISICVHAPVSEKLFIVPDLREDDRFTDNPFVVGEPYVRFYASALLRSPEGQVVGTLFLLDTRPRQLTQKQEDTLAMFARHVMTLLEVRRQTRELETAKRTTERAVQARERFLATLSHELRTPLTPVMLSCSALLADPQVTASQRATVDLIQRNVRLQVRLIDDLLDFTLLGRHKLELKKEPVDMHEVIGEALSLIRGEPDLPRLSVSLTARYFTVEGDRSRLQQVMWNILRNAVKFTPASGGIDVSTYDAGDDRLAVRVQDSGEGIATDLLDRLHEPFEKGSMGPSRKKGGLGLGLTIAKGIVTLHGGSIRATSAGAATGSTFTIELPVIDAPVREEVIVAARPAQAPVRLKILLVEDQTATAVSLTMLLFRAGHEVLAAGSLAAAREIAEKQPFDVLVSDIGLPDGSGCDLMREMAQRYDVRGIALSGHGSPDDRRATREAGFALHLVKPVDYADVEGALAAVVV